jgi:hypothetical protein
MVIGSVSAGAFDVAKPSALATQGAVYSLSADGNRAALGVNNHTACGSILVWEPTHGGAVSFRSLVCDGDCGRFCGRGSVALAGTRAAWLETAGGNTFESYLATATLGRRAPVGLGVGDLPDGDSGTDVLAPVGDGRLLAFTLEVRCGDPDSGGDPPCPPGREAGDVVAATIWRSARRGRCPADTDYRAGHCARVAKANGELTVLAVEAGRIAARTDHGVRLLTSRGGRLQDFAVTKPSAAALSANRLAVRVADAVEIYDTRDGQLVSSLPAENNVKLEDLDHGVLVTTSGRDVTLRRLSNGRATTIHTGGIAHAQLEGPGLFVAAARRVTFTPMSSVLHRLEIGHA